MTPIKHYIFEAGEILSIKLTCRKCSVSINIPLNPPEFVPIECPYCKKEWLEEGTADYKSLQALLHHLIIIKNRSKETNCHIQFEINQPNS